MAATGRNTLAGCVAMLVVLIMACGKTERAESPIADRKYAQGDSITVTGTLIDSRCFNLDPQNAGNDHIRPEGPVKACAQACANMGFPAAVLVDGKPNEDVWVLITVPAILADYMAEQVRVTGVVRSAGVLIPSRVEYREDDSWLTIM